MEDMPARLERDSPIPDHDEAVDLGFGRSDIEALLVVRMPFGRYRGTILIDLPEEYLLWFERDAFPRGRLGQLMRLTLGIKRYGAEAVVKNIRRVASVNSDAEQAGR